MEDIDAAFHHSISRVAENPEKKLLTGDKTPEPSSSDTPKISLSGLLNALDGVGAQEGRLLFATTNRYETLDAALRRPGRMDVHVEFKLASQYQAAELFKRCIPDREFSVAALQGYLMMHKGRPYDATEFVDAWVQEEKAKRAEVVEDTSSCANATVPATKTAGKFSFAQFWRG